MNINQMIGLSSWTSIVIILWGLVTEIFASNIITWFAFVFFCFMGIISYSVGRHG